MLFSVCLHIQLSWELKTVGDQSDDRDNLSVGGKKEKNKISKL